MESRRSVPELHAGPDITERNMSRYTLDDLAVQYGTDKSSKHHYYTRYYERYFSPFRDQPINFLEIGIKDNASLQMWRDYFPEATIHGIDNRPICLGYAEARVKIFIGLQQDKAFLRKVSEEALGGFDIIVDDASHHNKYTIASFEFLFDQVKPGGIYAIEDLHCSYEQHGLFDNKRYEMTGFFIELINSIDLNGRRDIFKPIGSSQDFEKLSPELLGKLTRFERWIESIHFYEGMAFVLKRPK
jgi:hypothetical protein